MLVFLSGEREIHDTADALRRVVDSATPRSCPSTPACRPPSSTASSSRTAGGGSCSARTSPRPRSPCPACATSSTPASARISRYSRRLKVQRLPIEPISQASANQRAGRCGRVAPGIVHPPLRGGRLRRPARSSREPEILRTNLAVGHPPDDGHRARRRRRVPVRRAARHGGRPRRLPAARGAGARSSRRRASVAALTAIGRRLARLPSIPGSAGWCWKPSAHGCVREVLVIAAALSIQDPRERPSEHRDAADAAAPALRRVRLATCSRSSRCGTTSARSSGSCPPTSSASCAAPSSSTTSGCGSGRTSYSQLRQVAGELGHPRRRRGRATRTAVHQAVLAGLLSHVGMRDRDDREFRGARGASFVIAPGSVLAKRPPRWVMAAELVETNRLCARRVATIQPGVGRAPRRPPRQALLRRATVGRPPRAGRHQRDGDAVRPADRRPDASSAYDRVDPAAATGDVHPPRARRRRLDGAPRASSRRNAAFVDRRRGARGAGPSRSTCSTTRSSSSSTTSGSPDGVRLGPPLRSMVARRRRRRSAPPRPHRGLSSPAGRRAPRRLPRHVARRRSRARR